jgi:hypothetical protein
MYEDKNLFELGGSTPSTYALQVLYHIIRVDHLSGYILTDNGKSSNHSSKKPIPFEIVNKLKSIPNIFVSNLSESYHFCQPHI